jgi:hypothetical protein
VVVLHLDQPLVVYIGAFSYQLPPPFFLIHVCLITTTTTTTVVICVYIQAFCDLEPIYSYEGTYDINSLVTGREVTGTASFRPAAPAKARL